MVQAQALGKAKARATAQAWAEMRALPTEPRKEAARDAAIGRALE